MCSLDELGKINWQTVTCISRSMFMHMGICRGSAMFFHSDLHCSFEQNRSENSQIDALCAFDDKFFLPVCD